MTTVTVPTFGDLLREHLDGVPRSAYPYLLSCLERTAAQRYRGWAEAVPEHRDGLLACAGREDEIADRVQALFPPSADDKAMVEAVMPAAKQTYYDVFEGHDPFEQMFIQADAEKQGSQAWQNMKAAYPEHSAAMDALTALELESGRYLDALLADR
ncbi:MAG: hypothetical protein AAGI15_12035 [Pseudomonadota bacterium]